MIFSESKLFSADNTDIKKVKCIKILGGIKRRYARLGEIIKIRIYKRKFKKNIIKKKVYLALIISLKRNYHRGNGIFIKFDKNRCLTLSENLKFLGTRVYGAVCKEIRKDIFKKIISYSKIIL